MTAPAGGGCPAGGAVVVTGEAGIGKTALLRHLVDRAGDEGVIVGWGRCPESASDAPYRSWTMAARQAAANGGPPELVSLLARADAELADDPTAARLVTHLAVVDALQASTEPVLLVIDDLQWADDATLAMVEFLATELAYLPLVLALSVRRSGLDRCAPGGARLPGRAGPGRRRGPDRRSTGSAPTASGTG